MAKTKDLKASLEDEIKTMLGKNDEPSEGRMKLIALGIKMCALNAKLEESQYGEFFADDPGDPKPPREKSSGGKRANGGEPAS